MLVLVMVGGLEFWVVLCSTTPTYTLPFVILSADPEYLFIWTKRRRIGLVKLETVGIEKKKNSKGQ